MSGALTLSFLLGVFTVGLAHPVDEIRACMHDRIEKSVAGFAGNASCPAECAHCHQTSLPECPGGCLNAHVFCSCAPVMYQALEAAQTCCAGLSDSSLVDCDDASGELEGVANQLHHNYCYDGYSKHEAVKYPNMKEIVSKSLDGSSPASLQEVSAAKKSSASAYVGAHRLGVACVALLEDIEAEAASHSGALDEMPDLRAAARHIAGRASGVLGRELPALAGKVHSAMTVAWTDNGPGLNAEGICEVILRHHDSQ